MELEKASEEIIAARRHLAEHARTELTRAGLPVIEPEIDELTTPGATIEIDPRQDTAGGVFLDWMTGPELRKQAIDAVDAGDLTDTAIFQKGAICQAMVTAMTTILAEAGFAVKKTDDRGYRPLQAEIWGCPHTTTH